ncbi:MAG: hypothetical protein R3F11_01390 [Verrucomicrobiales bacterium]
MAVPIVQSGTMDLLVKVTRAEGFTKPINIRMLWNPPGIGCQNTVQIPEGQNEVAYALNANGNAGVGTWQIAVLGEADAGKGLVLASSALTPLEVAPPYLGMKIELAAVEKGKGTTVICKLEQQKEFEGKARAVLGGLPAKVTAEPIEITKETQEIAFPIQTAEDSPVGKHGNLFCQVIIEQNGNPIPHTVGQGGVLRIDNPPPAPKKEEPKPEVAKEEPKKEEKPPEKRLSRLEQLRLAAEEARKGASN